MILPLTGGAAFLGKPEKQALDALEGVVNKKGGIGGRPVKFTYYDDATTPATDVQLVNQIKAKNVPVILGPSLVASCNAAAPIVANGPVLYCFSPGIHPAKDSYSFTSSVSTIDLNRALFKYFKAKGMTKIATITSTDATGQDADNAIKTAVTENPGVTLVAQEHFNTTDVSVSAQISADQVVRRAGPGGLEHRDAGGHGVPRRRPGWPRHPDRDHRWQHDLRPDGAVRGVPAEGAAH
ncbi:MAG TPA: hypothetical protein DIU14_04435, partial [Actinobacteria bacterium]|nr:hypothetical protein [Actinomycetota bacterium]